VLLDKDVEQFERNVKIIAESIVKYIESSKIVDILMPPTTYHLLT